MKRLLQKIGRNPFYIRWTHWEFWPMQFLYIPVYLQHIWLSAKAGNFFFILRTNPAIKEGLLLDDPKYKTLEMVPREYLPKTLFITKNHSVEALKRLMEEADIAFPV
ncbi:MAG: hypothetical protein KDD04_02565, partial [Sinomicrobium sp.]|nr:hypothetical protein [Sinomicrobium sp.]